MFIKRPWLLICFILSTLLFLLFSNTLNNKNTTIKPYSVEVQKFIDNKLVETIKYPNTNKVFSCNVENNNLNTFCKINFFMSNNITKGIDLSGFDFISFNIENLTSNEHDKFNIYLKNYNPSYSNESNLESLKGNGLFINKINNIVYDKISMKDFHINDSWVEKFNIPHNQLSTEFGNISVIQIKTAKYQKAGNYKIKVNKIFFKGTWISKETIFWGLIFKWLSITLLYVSVFLLRENKRAETFESKNTRLKSSTKKIIESYKKDPLTGVYNRQAFKQWLIYNKKDFELSVVYMDLDHFKNVNDEFGHLMGDKILCDFAKLVRDNLSEEYDIFCRWGGEEFIIFCKEKDTKYAIKKIKKIRKCMATYKWSHNQALTISAGISSGNSKDINKIIENADNALYLAKDNGRNGFRIHEYFNGNLKNVV